MSAYQPMVELSRAEEGALLDTWDEETTVSGTAFFPVVARIVILRLSKAEREIERLLGVCRDWKDNYQSWVDANKALTERAEKAEAQVRVLSDALGKANARAERWKVRRDEQCSRAEKAEAAIARLVVACGDLDREARDSGSAEGFLGTSLIKHLLSGGSLDDYDYTGGDDS